jgi:hypothetical protein
MYLKSICIKCIKTDSWDYGKLSVAGTPPNLGPILEHITVSAEMQIISIIAAGNQTSVQAVLTPKYHQIIRISKHKMISGR